MQKGMLKHTISRSKYITKAESNKVLSTSCNNAPVAGSALPVMMSSLQTPNGPQASLLAQSKVLWSSIRMFIPSFRSSQPREDASAEAQKPFSSLTA